jgi:hypothetical protein
VKSVQRKDGGTPFYRRWWFLVLLFVLVWVVAFTLGRRYGREEKAAQTIVYTSKTQTPQPTDTAQTPSPASETQNPVAAPQSPWSSLVPSPPPLP